jgi:hypothetical protein
MKPFKPAPPIWAERLLHDEGRITRNLMGLALASLETGAISPSMLQYPGFDSVASVQTGGFRFTPDTGSPISETGIEAPSFSAVQSIVVITFDPVCALQNEVEQKRHNRMVARMDIAVFPGFRFIVFTPVLIFLMISSSLIL